MLSALIDNGVVVNVCLGLPDGAIPCDDGVQIGWYWDGTVFRPPTAPVMEIDMDVVRQVSLARLEQLASAITAQVIGTDDPQKLKRYDNNTACADAVLGGTASAEVVAAMTAQLQANQAETPSVFGAMDVAGFCRWLLALRARLEVVGLIIEAARIQSRHAVSRSASVQEADAALREFEHVIATSINSH